MKPNDKRGQTLGDGPISPVYLAQMQALALGIDEIFNGGAKGDARTTGFVLLVFPFGVDAGGRSNYISNADRADVLTLLKEQVARFEGRLHQTETRQ